MKQDRRTINRKSYHKCRGKQLITIQDGKVTKTRLNPAKIKREADAEKRVKYNERERQAEINRSKGKRSIYEKETEYTFGYDSQDNIYEGDVSELEEYDSESENSSTYDVNVNDFIKQPKKRKLRTAQDRAGNNFNSWKFKHEYNELIIAI